VAPYQRDAMDFVLWKPSGPHDPAWDSPGGIAAPGRPGWHIECSAMSWKHLVKAFETRVTCANPNERETFDIHGGGIDLVFPHHENEIAQTCCAFDTPRMANVWMHNGFLQVESEKMSKSLGNFFTINELLADWPGEVLRFNMLRTHYRQPIDWTERGLEESQKTLQTWIQLLERFETSFTEGGGPTEAFKEALYDDLNTPLAIAELHSLASAARGGSLAAAQSLRDTLNFLGLISHASMSRGDQTEIWRAAHPEKAKRIDELIAARVAARAAKNWPESDRLRDEIVALGVVLMDNKDGTTTWEIAR
jgi:cysteinyl-tRNA synthetase